MNRITASLAAATCLLASCSKPGADADPGTGAGDDRVLTTFYPTTYFAERIAGGLVEVACPLPDDADPIFWQPPREALAQYQAAGLIVLNGGEFEKWAATASLPSTRVIESASDLEGGFIRYEEATTHRHGPDGEHSHEGIDGHTWLDPVIAKRQADAIRAAMAKRWPAHAAAFQANHDALAADLDALHTRLESLSPPPLLASHPAYNYLARRYGWDIDNLDFDPEEMPDDAALEELGAKLAARPVKLLLWEGEPTPEIAAALRDRFGLESITFSPCETAPGGDLDYISAMQANLDRLANAGKP